MTIAGRARAQSRLTLAALLAALAPLLAPVRPSRDTVEATPSPAGRPTTRAARCNRCR